MKIEIAIQYFADYIATEKRLAASTRRYYVGEVERFGKYLEVHDQMKYEDILKISGSTEIAYKAGLNIKLVPGEDEVVMESIFGERKIVKARIENLSLVDHKIHLERI